jgi:hypothetical protein
LTSGFNINWIDLVRIQVCSTNNIALNRLSSASSQESSSYPAANAFDGDPTTRWSSAFTDPQWIQVDLGSSQQVARIRLIWESAFARSYTVQFSADANTWNTVYTTTNGPGQINDLAASGTGRYVRVYATQRGTQYGDSLYEFEVYPVPQPAAINHISPPAGSVFVDPSANFSFTASSANSTIPTNRVQVILNGIDVSSQLIFSGSPTNWTVTFPHLQPNGIYSAIITVTNALGQQATTVVNDAFDTFSQSNLMVEAEDFDFGGGQYINNPVPSPVPAANSYYMQVIPALWGVDLTTPNTISGEEFAYRNDSCGTQIAGDFLREKYVDAGVPDYNVGWWYAGAWLNYTRDFPTNNYYTYGRLASGNGAYSAIDALVTNGLGTSYQTTLTLGTFSGLGTGWQNWQWVGLMNSNLEPAVVALGGVNTLKMISGDSLNANFYMFVPAPSSFSLSATLSNDNPVVSFPTQPGFNYMLVYKNDLADTWWKWLDVVAGDGTRKSISDTPGGQGRFYRAVVQ